MRSSHVHCCSKSYWGYWPYWWGSQWAQYLWRGIWTIYLPVRWVFLPNQIVLIYQCVEIDRWLLLHLKMCNLKMLASSKRHQMKKSSCLFKMGTLKVNERWCLIGMLDVGIRINDNINPNGQMGYENERNNTTCSFPYIGKSKELDYIRKISTWGDELFRSLAIISSQSIWSIQLTAIMEMATSSVWGAKDTRNQFDMYYFVS